MTFQNSRGYALIAALILLVIASLGAVVAVERAQLDAQREREAELLFVGEQYRQAIVSFYRHVPQGGAPQYPDKLQDLLADARFPNLVRHLRKLYPDPITGQPDWDLVLAGGRIIGVHSRSQASPLRHAGFALADMGFGGAHSYQDWTFTAGVVFNGAPVAVSSVPAASTGPGSGMPAAAPPSGPSGQPSPPPDPNQDRKTDCYNEFQVPRSQCTDDPPPIGNSVQSCIKTYTLLYSQCMAAIRGN